MIDIYEVVKKLVGLINPVGETNIDNDRFENLKQMTDLVEKLLSDIDWLNSYKNNHQFSMKRSAEFASDFQDSVGIKK